MRIRRLSDEIYHTSLIISAIIILLVQMVSGGIVSHFMRKELIKSAVATANEMSEILQAPLFNIDDHQAQLICETLIASGRVIGVYLESTATGVLVNTLPPTGFDAALIETRDIEFNGLALGKLTLYYSSENVRQTLFSIILIMIFVIASVTAANLLANHYLLRNRLTSVLSGLLTGVSSFGEEHFDQRVEECGFEDIDVLVRIFNDMADRVRAKTIELREVNSNLERRVEERTAELEGALSEQRLLQDRLVEAGKLSALGLLVAGIAHELNTPIGAILSSNRTLSSYFDTMIAVAPSPICEYGTAERALYDAAVRASIRANLVLSGPLPERKMYREVSERLSGAGIPNDRELAELLVDSGVSGSLDELIPLLGNRNSVQILRQASAVGVARRMTTVIGEAGEKAASVVDALRLYLSPQSGESSRVLDLSVEIKRVLTLMHNMLKHGIRVETALESVYVRGSSEKLAQVWMNLIRNAAQAMDFTGEMHIILTREDGVAVVRVIDSGKGIPEDISHRIFEPFFTTKIHGDGMGLGLDISKKVVESHNGTIEFESRPGRTEFRVRIPAVDTDKAMDESISGEGQG